MPDEKIGRSRGLIMLYLLEIFSDFEVINLKALLALEDGLVLRGRSFTGEGESAGEVVFNTAMTGYQEILTDPSYKGQIVTMTYPLIGNYGINPEDIESRGVQVEGFIVKEYHPYPSNWRSQGNLADYLKAAGKLGVEGFDTRAITKRLRQVGAMRGLISSVDLDPDSLVRRARELPSMEGQDLVPLVTCKRPYWWPQFPADTDDTDLETLWGQRSGKKVVLYDYGVKFNIIRSLIERGLHVLVVPATTPAAAVLAPQARRHRPQQRPGRPGRGHLRGGQRAPVPGRGSRVRHLPGAPAPGSGPGRPHLQAQVRPPGRQPAGEESCHRPGGDHLPESRLCGGFGLHPRSGGGTDPHQLERQYPGGPAPPGAQGLLGAVPPRGLAGPA